MVYKMLSMHVKALAEDKRNREGKRTKMRRGSKELRGDCIGLVKDVTIDCYIDSSDT